MKKYFLIFSLLTFYKVSAQHTSENLTLMPWPKSVDIHAGQLRINSEFTVNLTGQKGDDILEEAANRFLYKLNRKTLAYFKQEKVVLNQVQSAALMQIDVNEKVEADIGIDESYQISITDNGVHLSAPTTAGALFGLESLLQLVAADSVGFYFPALEIKDAPRFGWRGMMLDVSRHFIPMDILKRNIDAMAGVKLNVLHLHLTDDEGFRVESKVFPRLHEKGSKGQFYTQEEIKDLVTYAKERGIMVYPEFDLPGHSTSWFAGYPELASAPGPYEPGHRYKVKEGASMQEAMQVIMNSALPTLDPSKESTFQFLDQFIEEISSLFPSPYMHIGADENNGLAWLENPEIAAFMKQKGFENAEELQAYFVERMHEILSKHHKTTIGWEELYNADLSKEVIVQQWGAIGANRLNALEIAQKGNKVLISKGFYLDYFLEAKAHYYNPNIPKEVHPNILGGEAALWSELVDENSFETRAWPRTAAVAERLWSPESVYDADEMYRRLFIVEDKLEENGLNHRLNSERMLSALANGQDISAALKVLTALAPARGYGRLLTQFVATESKKYQSVPLVAIEDLVACDYEEAWVFKTNVEEYLQTRDDLSKVKVLNQLQKWNLAAIEIPQLLNNAPKIQEFASYADRLSKVTQIGLSALKTNLSKEEKKILSQELKTFKQRGDKLEIQILPQIEALISAGMKN
ncbi:beta-N-acetylhexosaminidase [Jiulongibacter sp. NS-SX5]|uniref:beta-N-acetylhexosaminidase n=1 Tax=Jiulongibacter sp. NS-SX5 TaxID=3463854 RepID=UPI00405A2AD1